MLPLPAVLLSCAGRADLHPARSPQQPTDVAIRFRELPDTGLLPCRAPANAGAHSGVTASTTTAGTLQVAVVGQFVDL